MLTEYASPRGAPGSRRRANRPPLVRSAGQHRLATGERPLAVPAIVASAIIVGATNPLRRSGARSESLVRWAA